MPEWIDEWMDESIGVAGWVDRRMDEWIVKLRDESIAGWVDECIDRWMSSRSIDGRLGR